MNIPRLSTVTMFVDDIREEVGGQMSLIGVLPDNMRVPSIPGFVSKLGIYTRCILPTEGPAAGDVTMAFLAPNGQVVTRNVISAEQLNASKETSASQGAEVTTMLSRMILSPFPVTLEGRFRLNVTYDGEDYLSGFINIVLDPETAK